MKILLAGLTALSMDVIAGTPAELAATTERELPQWGALIRAAGIKAAD